MTLKKKFSDINSDDYLLHNSGIFIHLLQKSNKVVYGYHGTTVESARMILQNGFKIYQNKHRWLGEGIYFFQDAPEHAWKWANWIVENFRNRGTKPLVLGAIIDLEGCMDLVDRSWFETIRQGYISFVENCRKTGSSVPEQIGLEKGLEGLGGKHYLDCAVINHTIQLLEEQDEFIKSIRSVFWEGYPIYDTSHFIDEGHIAIAIRNPSVIKKLFVVRNNTN